MRRRIGIGGLAPLAAAGILVVSACAARTTGPGALPGGDPSGRTMSGRSADSLRALKRLAAERGKAGRSGSYRLGPGDLVEVAVFDLKEMNRRVRVAESGEVSLPLIGTIRALGKTEAELARDIADRLSREYLQSPQVDVFIVEYRGELVAVTGSVGKPGLYPLLRDRNTILDLIAVAGGITRGAGAFIDFIPARSGGAKQAMSRARAGDVRAPTEDVRGISIDLAELMRGANRALLRMTVIPGDVIYVPQGGMFSVEGWVDRPGTYVLARGMTVLSAISAGGGELFPGALSRVELFREEAMGERAGTMETIDIKAVRQGQGRDVVLRAGDVVRVPANLALLGPYGLYWFYKTFIGFGLGGGASIPVS